jgi:hypothetical protein
MFSAARTCSARGRSFATSASAASRADAACASATRALDNVSDCSSNLRVRACASDEQVSVSVC